MMDLLHNTNVLVSQASSTADDYAIQAKKSFERLTGLDIGDHPLAFATFASGFIQAAAVDFATATLSGVTNSTPLHSLMDALEMLVTAAQGKLDE